MQLFNNSDPVDIKTVVHQLRKNGKLELVGGSYYVSDLTTRVNSAANIEYHARIISEQSIKRQLIRISSELVTDAYEDTTDVFQLLNRTEQALFQVSESHYQERIMIGWFFTHKSHQSNRRKKKPKRWYHW